MSLKLYNTLTRKTETFRPLSPSGEVKIYTCGPTVYNYQHIGNYAAYIYWDLLVRTLTANGFSVRRVLNLTDVGHLVSDGDTGEDKLEKGAAREGKTVYEIANYYIEDFLDNFHKLHLVEPTVIARATDYIKEDMKAVSLMSGHGYTYETEDGVYYDTARFASYPDFARLDLSGLKAGARVEYSDEKINPSDFAVWKFIKPGEKHAMRWDYLGRPGYPGWHLECSTIIHEELGEPIDIHAGGIDHIPVHHTNEIAETYAAYGKPLSRFWLHANFITIDGEKISKSLGNVYLFTDLAERGFDELDYKMWVLSGHYQGTRNFTYDSLAAAKARRLNWRSRIALLYQATASEITGKDTTANTIPSSEDTTTAANDSSSSQDSDFYSHILAAVNNNLNSPEAFAIIDNADLSLSDWQKIDDLFGLNLIASTPDISDEAKSLIRERQSAREQKDYALSDSLRDQLAQMNIKVNDTPTGPIWEYIS